MNEKILLGKGIAVPDVDCGGSTFIKCSRLTINSGSRKAIPTDEIIARSNGLRRINYLYNA